MTTLSKRVRANREKMTPGKLYTVTEALKLLKDMALAKFRESVDLSVNLGIDSRKSDQAIGAGGRCSNLFHWNSLARGSDVFARGDFWAGFNESNIA